MSLAIAVKVSSSERNSVVRHVDGKCPNFFVALCLRTQGKLMFLNVRFKKMGKKERNRFFNSCHSILDIS